MQNAEQLLILRSLTDLGAGGVWSAVFPIAAELMPAQHRRTYGAVYEMALASSFTVLPAVGGLLSGNPAAFRLMALPGGLALFVVPAIVYYPLPESPRWHLRRGEARIAVATVNRIIGRSGNRVPPLAVEELGDVHAAALEKQSPYRALFAKGQLRWTLVGMIIGCATISACRNPCGEKRVSQWAASLRPWRSQSSRPKSRNTSGRHRAAIFMGWSPKPKLAICISNARYGRCDGRLNSANGGAEGPRLAVSATERRESRRRDAAPHADRDKHINMGGILTFRSQPPRRAEAHDEIRYRILGAGIKP